MGSGFLVGGSGFVVWDIFFFVMVMSWIPIIHDSNVFNFYVEASSGGSLSYTRTALAVSYRVVDIAEDNMLAQGRTFI